MESDNLPASMSLVKCSNCGCSCSTMNRSLSGTYLPSVSKRRFDEYEDKSQSTSVPGLLVPQNARVEAENECRALREMVGSQQLTIQDLISELDEERNASASAANEAMSMILRLQREKAEIQMEFRQFKRFAEEKMAHDNQELLALEDSLYKRERTIQSLTGEIKAYKLMESDGVVGEKRISRNTSIAENLDLHRDIYPRLRCKTNESQDYDGDYEATDIEEYQDAPNSQDQLKDLEYRINQLENSPRTAFEADEDYISRKKDAPEKVIVGQTPLPQTKHRRMFSSESLSSPFAIVKEMGPEFQSDFLNVGSRLKMDHSSDDTSDKIYTIDSIQQGAPVYGTVKQKPSLDDSHVLRDLEIQKLYARLQALEADRETMRQTIISMGTDKAQLVLLKEIAQNLCKDMPHSGRRLHQKRMVGRKSSFLSTCKWIASFMLWRNKARGRRHMMGLPESSAGLLMLLDRRP
ncbi:hypothetical protein M569_10936, partial [Genlisea aurea]